LILICEMGKPDMSEKDKQFPNKASAQEYVLTQSTVAAITSIAIVLNQEKGAGFFLSGPFGSGKTRLLMTLRDLSVTQGALPWLRAELEVFDEPDRQQIQFVRKVFQTHRVAACYVNLGASNQSLSAALQEVIHQQHPQILPHKADLLDSLDAIDAGLLTSDYDMLVVLVDELASNLGSKDMSDALQDMIFLQQLGEALHDHRIVLVLTVHESISALDNLRYDQLSKFKDRYRVLPLHIEGALARRFATHFDDDDLVVKAPRSYHQKLHEATEIYDVHEPQDEYDLSTEMYLGEATLGKPSETEIIDWSDLEEMAPAEAEPPAASLVEDEVPDWLEEMAPAEAKPSAPPTTTIMDPVRKLAKILVERCDQGDLDFFLQSRGIKGRTLEARVLELCITEDPGVILTELFGIGRLRGTARDLEVEIEPSRSVDQLREAILVALGFSTPKKPAGISTYKQKLVQLRSTLKLKGQRADIIGIGLEGCDDVGERVLKDLIGFYCTVLLGKDYEKVLLEKELVPAKGRPGIDGLTFGQKIGLFGRLNGYLKKSKEAREIMDRWFDRVWVIKNKTHVQQYLNRVSPRRNHLAHPQGIDTPTLKREAGEALELLVELFEQFEKQLIYPPVIAVEALQIDRYGRRTYVCVDDRGCPERLFTSLELVVGQEYFFYPITNPIRVDPLIVPKS
jgi:hypothetical protein